MNASIRITSSLLIVAGLLPAVCGRACDCATPSTSTVYSGASVCGQEYRLVYKTVCEQRQRTAYKIEYETAYEERPVTTYKPVWETQMREERYTVARPVTETSEREEVYTVQKPVWETQMRDNSYTRVRYVQETAEREERYTVNRPITETGEREEVYNVLKPVYETSCRTETYTVMRPQTVCQTQMVDRGGFVEQTVMKPECRPRGCDGCRARARSIRARARRFINGPGFTGCKFPVPPVKFKEYGSRTMSRSRCSRRSWRRKPNRARCRCKPCATSRSKWCARFR